MPGALIGKKITPPGQSGYHQWLTMNVNISTKSIIDITKNINHY